MAGLTEEPPTLLYGDRRRIGSRSFIRRGISRLSARTVPVGIWAAPGGRFEMRLIEYPTRVGTRTICEVVVDRGKPPLNEAEAEAVADAFDAMRADAIAAGGWEEAALRSDETRRTGMERVAPNDRDCPVIASLSIDPSRGYFRSSVSEKVGAPMCGGKSLYNGGPGARPFTPDRNTP